MQAGKETGRRRETDGSRCEGGSRVSTGEELCFRSALPKICLHHPARARGKKRAREQSSGQNTELRICRNDGGWGY